MIIGLIPAAGKAKRFDGLYKEMLPNKEGIPFIKALVNSLSECVDKVVIVTSPEKIALHASLLASNPKVIFKLQDQYNRDLVEAIYSGITAIEHDACVFCMPDTVFPHEVIPSLLPDGEIELSIGQFTTDRPEDFGVIDEDSFAVHDKDMTLKGTIQSAWGVLGWGKNVSKLFIRMYEETSNRFPEMLTQALQDTLFINFVGLDYYYDMKNLKAYRDYLNEDTSFN